MRSGLVTLVCASLLLISGCSGDRHVQVTGTLLDGSQPVQPKDGEELTVTFVAVNQDAKMQVGTAEFESAGGSFTVHGSTRDGIPPGEYRIVVRCTPYTEDEPDRFAGAFSEDKTPLRYTVTDDRAQEIVIDIKGKTVTRK